ncbi:hypothetical protein EN978_07260 [Mesorhizobium sp. M7A.F.Ca.US.001.04.1.1]|uniref:hypothetical protein n=1 Tax=unclassified Mesorhizobium TaxID=325217 RepID=UPI000FC9B009|nr:MULTISPECIES: hypothetical protein [unclassified Mesorhizobium]RUY31688.1 hypothetical protein EN979_02020 [Mesorhizobium sp. M7A.F.Ca.US.001.04.2.1]RUY44124.1 hypothetical protein EN978_07260 [Mesorhizobium sp. M7A.F.Ca.US.001.04.1.1]
MKQAIITKQKEKTKYSFGIFNVTKLVLIETYKSDSTFDKSIKTSAIKPNALVNAVSFSFFLLMIETKISSSVITLRIDRTAR